MALIGLVIVVMKPMWAVEFMLLIEAVLSVMVL